jgi:type IV pilus assembly protein PilX
MLRNFKTGSPARQGGATLVIAMLILVLIMMIGITAISTSDTQFKLAGNLQFEDSAMNNTEIAISAAESWLTSGTNFEDAGFTAYNGVATPHVLPKGHLANDPLTMAWNDTNSLAVAGNGRQRYFIEQMSRNNRLPGSSQVQGGRCSAAPNTVNTYLITARGTSNRGATKFVQSYFSVVNRPTC